jgi:hypothetical protein
VIATEADLGDAAEWHFFDIDYLITKTAIDKCLQQRRDLFPGKPTVHFKYNKLNTIMPIIH